MMAQMHKVIEEQNKIINEKEKKSSFGADVWGTILNNFD
jgi:hypothetical protein